GALHGQGNAVVLLTLRGVVAHLVDSFLGLAHCLEPGFADFDQASRGQLELFRLELVGEATDQDEPLLPGHCRPRFLCSARRGHGTVYLPGGSTMETTEKDPAIDRREGLVADA